MSMAAAATPSNLPRLFARFVAEQAGQPESGVLARTAAWLAEAQERGDVCLDLARHAGAPWPDREGDAPPLADWCRMLGDSPCVGAPGARAPMVLDGHRLYLYRFWRDETRVAEGIRARLQAKVALQSDALRQGLARLFPADGGGGVDWQKLAAAVAVSHRFAVISGGPGTGKTASLVKVLALLLEQTPDLHIRLAAPTGKAAARMMASINNAKATIATDDAIKARIPDAATTLHRLLGYGPRGYRHDRDNPLVLDCLVIDEASMVDLPMMARLIDALPEGAQLILLGDRDQLASVEAGNVLGDVTGHGHAIAYRPQTAALLASVTGIDARHIPVRPDAPPVADAIALLRKSYRFAADSGIGNLAFHINAGEADAAVAWLSGRGGDALAWHPDPSPGTMLAQVVEGYTAYLQAEDVGMALDRFARQRVLCALRQGAHGVERVNREIAAGLRARGLLAAGDLVAGMPIMVTGNSYALDLFNGDIGLLWHNEEGQLRAYFRDGGQGLRALPPQLLPQYEPAWAMTVHKSQGSEFDHVVLLLPEAGGGVLTRELLYTAVTRAKQRFTLFASRDAVDEAISHTIQRSSGLAARLGWLAESSAAAVRG